MDQREEDRKERAKRDTHYRKLKDEEIRAGVEAVAKENAQLRDDLMKLREVLDASIRSSSETTASDERQITALETETTSLKQAREQDREKLAELHNVNFGLQRQLEDARKTCDPSHVHIEMIHHKQRISDLETQLQTLQDTLRESEEVCDSMLATNKEHEDLQHGVHQQELANVKRSEYLASKENTLRLRESDLSKAEDEFVSKQKQVRKAQQEVDTIINSPMAHKHRCLEIFVRRCLLELNLLYDIIDLTTGDLNKYQLVVESSDGDPRDMRILNDILRQWKLVVDQDGSEWRSMYSQMDHVSSIPSLADICTMIQSQEQAVLSNISRLENKHANIRALLSKLTDDDYE